MKQIKTLEFLLMVLAVALFGFLAYNLKYENNGACWAFGGLLTFCLIGLIFIHNIKNRK